MDPFKFPKTLLKSLHLDEKQGPALIIKLTSHMTNAFPGQTQWLHATEEQIQQLAWSFILDDASDDFWPPTEYGWNHRAYEPEKITKGLVTTIGRMIKKESKQQDTIVLSDDEVDKEANRRESSHQELDRNRHNARADEAVTTRRSSRTAKVGSARKSQPLPKKAGLSRKGKEKAGPENIVQSRDDREETVGRATSAPRRPSSAVPLGNATCPEEHHTVTATALDPNTPSATGQTGTNEAPAPRGAIEAGRKRNHDEFGPYTTPVIQPRCSKIRHVEMRQSPAETEDMYGPPAHRLPASTGAQSSAELPATPPPNCRHIPPHLRTRSALHP